MKEDKIYKLLCAALDKELLPKEKAFVINKIAKDPSWKSKYEELKKLKSLIANSKGDLKPSPGFEHTLMRKINEDKQTDSYSLFRAFIDRGFVDKLAYGLAICSFLFIVYVGFEVYKGINTPSLIDNTTSSHITNSTKSKEVLGKGVATKEAKKVFVSNDSAFTTIMNKDGALFVSKDDKSIVIDIYSGKIDGSVDRRTKHLFTSVISNIDVYRKIYLSHYPKHRVFKRVDNR